MKLEDKVFNEVVTPKMDQVYRSITDIRNSIGNRQCTGEDLSSDEVKFLTTLKKNLDETLAEVVDMKSWVSILQENKS